MEGEKSLGDPRAALTRGIKIMTKRRVHPSTYLRLSALRRSLGTGKRPGTYRATTKALGLEEKWVSTIWRALHHDGVSPEYEDVLRVHMGMQPLRETQEVPVCPIHGEAHYCVCTEDRPVERVVALAPGETTRRKPKPGKPRDRQWRPRLDPGLKGAAESAGLDGDAISELIRLEIAKKDIENP